jgi:hypothetical protein
MSTSSKALAYEPFQALSVIEYAAIQIATGYRAKDRNIDPTSLANEAWADACALVRKFVEKRDEHGIE